MATSRLSKRPTAPDVKQGPLRRGARKKIKKVVDTPADNTIPSIIDEPINQETQIMSEVKPNEPTTKKYDLEKITKYGAVIYRNPELGTATFTKTEFQADVPASVLVTAVFKDKTALSDSDIEKLQKSQEKLQKQLEKKQANLDAVKAKLEAAKVPTPEQQPA